MLGQYASQLQKKHWIITGVFCCVVRKVGIAVNVIKKWMQPIITFFLYPYYLYYVVRYEDAWIAVDSVGIWGIQVGYPVVMVCIFIFLIKNKIPKRIKRYLRKKECYVDKYFYKGYVIAFVSAFILQYPFLWLVYFIFCLPTFVHTCLAPICDKLLEMESVVTEIIILLIRLMEVALIIVSPIIELILCGILALVIPMFCMRLSMRVTKKLRTVPVLEKYRGKRFTTIGRQVISKYQKKHCDAKIQKDLYEQCLKEFLDSGDYAVLLNDNIIFEKVNLMLEKKIQTEYDTIPIVNADRESYLQVNQDRFIELEEIMTGIYATICERCDWVRNKKHIINSLKYSKWNKGDVVVNNYAKQMLDMEVNFKKLKHNFEDVKQRFEDIYEELNREYYGIHKGIEGEKLVSGLLEKYTDSLFYFSNISLKHGKEKCEIDDLIVCPQGIFVVEVKNIGNSKRTITIDKTGRWLDSNNKSEYITWNAKIQNDKHVRVCEKIVNEILERNMSTRLYVQGIIVIANEETNIVNYSEQKVIRVNGLIDTIRASRICLKDSEMNLICEKIMNYRVPTTMYEVTRYDKIADAFDDFFCNIEIQLTRCENLAVWKTRLDRQMMLIEVFNNKKEGEKIW